MKFIQPKTYNPDFIHSIYLKIGVLLLVFGLISCQSNSPKQTDEIEGKESSANSELFTLSQEQQNSLKLEFTSPKAEQISAEKKVNGTVEVDPNASLEIHVPYAGYLKKSNLLDGKSVAAGEIIGVVENPYFLEVQRDFIQSRIELNKIKSEFERYQKLWNAKSLSEKEWIDAKSIFESAQLKYQGLRQLLLSFHLQPDKLNAENLSAQVPIISPIAGIITESNVNNGKFYQPDERIAKVINFSSAYLELTAFERDKNQIRIGDWIEAREIENSQDQLKAIITSIDPSIANDGSFKVIARIKSSSMNLKKGMHVQAIISGARESVFQLPKTCLVGNPDDPKLLQRVSTNQFKLVAISLIKEDNQFIYFQFKGIEKTENKYVSQGAYDIYMEMLKE